MSIFGKIFRGIGRGIKKVALFASAPIRELFDDPEDRERLVAFVRGAAAILMTEFGQAAIRVVSEVNTLKPNISNEQARASAVARLKEIIQRSGKSVKDSFIGLLVETAYNHVKDNFKAALIDSDGDGIPDIIDVEDANDAKPATAPTTEDAANTDADPDPGDTN